MDINFPSEPLCPPCRLGGTGKRSRARAVAASIVAVSTGGHEPRKSCLSSSHEHCRLLLARRSLPRCRVLSRTEKPPGQLLMQVCWSSRTNFA